MADLGKTKKMCPNGHLMDPAWDVCPYCPSDRQRSPTLARTVRMEEGPRASAGGEGGGGAGGGRKTEILPRDAVAVGGAVAWFVGVEKPHRGKMHRVDGERATVGASSDCDVVIDDQHISDHQASLRYKDKKFLLTDLDSTNGTFVNGERIGQQVALNDGDRVRFGSCEWIFKCVSFENA